MLLLGIPELSLPEVADRGVANRERIIVRARQQIDMSQLGLLVCVHRTVNSQPTVAPFDDFFYWFGNLTVEPNDHVFIYTGPGTARKTTVEGTQIPAWVFHWNRSTTIFANSATVPVLFRVGAMNIAQTPQNQSQGLLVHGG